MSQAVAYCRKSKKDDHEAMQTQRDGIAREAERDGIPIIAWYEDDGVSGGAEARVGLDAMMLHLRRGGVEVIYIYDRSRWVRSVKLGQRFDEELEELGVELRDRTPSTGDEDADWMRKTQEDVSNEWMRRLTRKKTRDGKLRIFNDGMPAGHVPVGWRSVHQDVGDRRVRVAVEVDPERGPVLQEAFRRYASGAYSLLDIATWAEGEGFTMPRSGLPPKRESWKHILFDRPQYMGWQQRGELRVRTAFPALVSEETWWAVQSTRATRRRGGAGASRRRRHPYPLRGLVLCQHGHRLTGHAVRKNGRDRTYRYYQHERRRLGEAEARCPATGIRADIAEGIVKLFLGGFEPDAHTLAMAQDLVDQDDEHERATDQLSRLAARRERLSYQHECGGLMDVDYVNRLAALTEEEARLRAHAEIDVAAMSAELTRFADVIDIATPDELERLYVGVLAEVRVESKTGIQIAPKAEYLPLLGAHYLQRYGNKVASMVAPTGLEATSKAPGPLAVRQEGLDAFEHA